MNFLTNYIKSNLGTYSDDSQIISILNKNKLIHLESIYDMNDKLSNNNRDIDFKKYDVITLTDLCFKPYKTAEIWFLEFSKNKKYLVLGFSNCNISLFTVKNNQNNNSIIINLYLTFSVNDNSKKGEITSVCFSNDEKYLLVSLSTNIIKLYNILNGEKIKEYSNFYQEVLIGNY